LTNSVSHAKRGGSGYAFELWKDAICHELLIAIGDQREFKKEFESAEGNLAG